MSQYLLLNRVKVQRANAIAGFTWGFPAITNFLGFTHNLSRKLKQLGTFDDLALTGCAVIVHRHQVHTYGYNEFIQSRNPAFQRGEQAKNKVGTPPVVEEGKMNMDVSLLIKCEGTIGNREETLMQWMKQILPIQRLAGGSIFGIGDIAFYRIDHHTKDNLRQLKRKLLPGFILQDRSGYLAEHYNELKKQNQDAELFDAWLDFIALKQKARPVHDLIDKHLRKLAEANPKDKNAKKLFELWLEHISPDNPYDPETIPSEIREYFASLPDEKEYKKLLAQWRSLKQKARPVYDLIDKHLRKLAEANPKDKEVQNLFELWLEHISPDNSCDPETIPSEIRKYFASLPDEEEYKKLLAQWRSYIHPDDKTDAVWEYIKKPKQGFLVPIMTGYKAISPVYKNKEVANTRDNETDVCFVEAVHTIGEWQGAHRLRSVQDLEASIWYYHYEPNWYLCRQDRQSPDGNNADDGVVNEELPDDDFS